jgi:hypothetical protein
LSHVLPARAGRIDVCLLDRRQPSPQPAGLVISDIQMLFVPGFSPVDFFGETEQY